MILLIGILIAGAAVAVLYSLGVFSSSSPKPEIQSQEENKEALQTEKISKLEQRVVSLERELYEAGSKHSKISEELKETKKEEAALNERLEKQKEQNINFDEEVKKTKEKNSELKERLINAENKLEETFSANVKLNKDFTERGELLESCKEDKRVMHDRILELEVKVKQCLADLEDKNKTITGFKKREKESSWVSKEEYEDLKQKLEEAEIKIAQLKDKEKEP